MTAEAQTKGLSLGAAVLGVSLVLLICMGILPLELAGAMLVGWVRYLVDTAPRVRVNWLSLVSAVVWIALFAAGLHGFCRWLYGNRGTSDSTDPDPATPRRLWRARWTAMLVGLVMFLFAAGTSAVCVAHQIGFLATSKSPMFSYRDRTADSHTVDIERFVTATTTRSSDLWREAMQWYPSASPFLDHHHVIAWSASGTTVDGVIAFHRDPKLRSQHGIVVATGGRQIVLSGDELPRALAMIPAGVNRVVPP